MSEFVEFPKIARLSRECVITEKIDGTNAQICIMREEPENDAVKPFVLAARVVDDVVLWMLAGSRNRYLTPDADNFGFARWVEEHVDELAQLGEGRHFGEWWGAGIQRRYGLAEKRFSLFNVARWADDRDRVKFPTDRPACCGVVPVLFRGPFTTVAAEECVHQLRTEGSSAAPGFMEPEGVVIFHTASSTLYKKTLEKDDEPKSKSAA